MSPRPRLTARAPIRSVPAKNTPTMSQRAQALTNSIAATAARKAGVRVVDWDAVIERHKAWMNEAYADDEDSSSDETNNPGVSQTVEGGPKVRRNVIPAAGIDQ